MEDKNVTKINMLCTDLDMLVTLYNKGAIVPINAQADTILRDILERMKKIINA